MKFSPLYDIGRLLLNCLNDETLVDDKGVTKTVGIKGGDRNNVQWYVSPK